MINHFLFILAILSFERSDLVKNDNIIIFRNDSFQSLQLKEMDIKSSRVDKFSERDEDTIFLDDGISTGYFIMPQDGYYAMRFSPGAICTLKSVLVTTYYTGPPCSILVWDNSPSNQPETLLTNPTAFTSIYNPVWQRIDLPSPVVVSSDFWIGIFAHCPPYPAIDYYSDYDRECVSEDRLFWWDVYEGSPELMIRVIGTLIGKRRDVSTEKLFLSSGPLLSNPTHLAFACIVKNYGNLTETNIPLTLCIYDSTLTIVFRDSTIVPVLEHLEEDTIAFPNQWNYNLNGHYIISVQSNVDNDCTKDNDTTFSEVFVLTYPAQFYYDDGDPDINAFDSTALKFTPPYYPCFIESVSYFVAANEESSANYDLIARILDDDGVNNSPGNEIDKDSIHGIYNGWNTIDFTQENAIIYSGSFYVQYIEKPFTYYMDLCADMTPPFVHLQWGFYLGQWYHWDNAYQEAMIRVSVAYPSAVLSKKQKETQNNSFLIKPSISKGRIECCFCNSKDGMVEIAIYGLDGRKVKQLFQTYLPAGRYIRNFDICDLTPGIYFVNFSKKNVNMTQKLIRIN